MLYCSRSNMKQPWYYLNICFYLRNLCISQLEDEPPSKLPLHSQASQLEVDPVLFGSVTSMPFCRSLTLISHTFYTCIAAYRKTYKRTPLKQKGLWLWFFSIVRLRFQGASVASTYKFPEILPFLWGSLLPRDTSAAPAAMLLFDGLLLHPIERANRTLLAGSWWFLGKTWFPQLTRSSGFIWGQPPIVFWKQVCGPRSKFPLFPYNSG